MPTPVTRYVNGTSTHGGNGTTSTTESGDANRAYINLTQAMASESRPPWLVTAPHTGTFFVGGLITQVRPHWTYQQHIKSFAQALEVIELVGSRRAIVTLRDPMLAMISTLNRNEDYTLESFRGLARFVELRPSSLTHLFRVDAPLSERDNELIRLAEFLNTEIPVTDWAPENSEPDVLGLKEAYAGGNVPSILVPYLKELETMHEVQALFARCGYKLRWM